MGLGVSRLPLWDDNHSGCPLISTGIGASIKLETLRHQGETLLWWPWTRVQCFFFWASHVCVDVFFLWIWFTVQRKRSVAVLFCFASQWVNLCFMEIKYGPRLPPCLQMVPVERGWLSGPSQSGNLRVLMLGGQCGATPSLLSPGAWIRSPLPAPCLWSSSSLLHSTSG